MPGWGTGNSNHGNQYQDIIHAEEVAVSFLIFWLFLNFNLVCEREELIKNLKNFGAISGAM